MTISTTTTGIKVTGSAIASIVITDDDEPQTLDMSLINKSLRVIDTD